MNISFCWLVNPGTSMYRSPYKNTAKEFVLTSSAEPNMPFAHITWIVCKISGCPSAVFRICSKLYTAFLGSSHQVFFPSFLLESMWCSHTVLLTQLQFIRIPVLFYQRSDFHMIYNQSIAVHTFC